MIKYTQKGIERYIDETEIVNVFNDYANKKTFIITRGSRRIPVDETVSLINQRITRALHRK